MHGNPKENAFTHSGFRDWKHAMGSRGIISNHDTSTLHKAAMASWNSYMMIMNERGTSIANQLQNSRHELVKSNQHYIKSLCDIIVFCAKQDLPLRGHRESDDSLNQGNFLEMLNLLAKHDQTIKEKLQSLPNNASYKSPEIQNTLLQVMGNLVRKAVCREIQKASIFSILVDETKDCSKKEQMSISFRYVDVDSATIFERFLTFVHAEKLDAESLTKYIIDTCNLHQLDPSQIVSQGYDGASVMSGKLSGVQAQIRHYAPNAIYIHCNAHCLNLCLVESVKAVKHAREFFALLEALYVFLSASKCHVLFLENQKKLYPTTQVRHLQRLSETRWACRANAVATLCYTYEAVVDTLYQFSDECSDGSRVCEANGLLSQIQSFGFILNLVVFDRILSVTKSLSDALQSPALDLAKASSLVETTIETIVQFRTDIEWSKIFSYTEKIANHHNISIPLSSTSARARRAPSRYDNAYITTSIGSRESPNASVDWKINVYFPIIDALLSELKRRFDEKNRVIMVALQACNPSSPSFLDPEIVKPLVEAYQMDYSSLAVEAPLVVNMLSKIADLNEISDALKELAPLKTAFPTVIKLLQLGMTISVTSAKCERTFSTLKRVKSYLRSTMTEERLANLAILSIERDCTDQLDHDEVLKEFSQSYRRIVLV